MVDYQQRDYHDLTAADAFTMIQHQSPLILDVRTKAEYQKGHLENAMLIPVEELQGRIGELDSHRGEDIFIYCATGYRSIVAAKILIDEGFARIYNLQYGIVDWQVREFPVVM